MILLLKQAVHFLCSAYALLLFIRIALSYFPALQRYPACRMVLLLTDPYLNLFRKVIPPLGGMLDISPILGFMVLRMVESFLLKVL